MLRTDGLGIGDPFQSRRKRRRKASAITSPGMRVLQRTSASACTVNMAVSPNLPGSPGPPANLGLARSKNCPGAPTEPVTLLPGLTRIAPILLAFACETVLLGAAVSRHVRAAARCAGASNGAGGWPTTHEVSRSLRSYPAGTPSGSARMGCLSFGCFAATPLRVSPNGEASGSNMSTCTCGSDTPISASAA